MKSCSAVRSCLTGCESFMRSPHREYEDCRGSAQRGVIMTVPHMTVVVVGSTGSIGRLVVEEAIRQGHTVRALVRTPDKARQLPAQAHVVTGDITRPETLPG